eukprot:Em0005g662a
MVSRKCLLVGASLLYLAAWIAITVKQFAEPELTSIHPETRARSSHSERGYDFTSSSLAGDKEKVTTSAPGSDSGDTAVLHTTTTTTTRTTATATTTTTAPRTPLTTNDVLDLVRSNYFREQGIRLKWIGERMERLAPLWKQTQQSLMARRPDVFAQPKSILLFPGLLDWGIVRDWQTFIDPFSVTLLDTGGQQVVSRQFSDARPFYVWHNVEHRARFVRLDSLDYKVARYFVLCSVEVYGEDSRVVPWPDLTLLQTVVSKTGQSCKEACMDHTMVCEPSYWHAINTHPVLKTHFTCLETLHLEGRFEQIFPAYAVENDDGLNIRKGSCVTTAEHMLLSCAAGIIQKTCTKCGARRYTGNSI